MYFHSKRLSDCSDDELVQLNKLTLKAEDGEGSWMSDMMDFAMTKSHRSTNVTVFLATHPETNKIIAWSFMEHSHKIYYQENKKEMPVFDFGVYVHPDYRRQGIAKQLIGETDKYSEKLNARIKVRPHDEKSSALFSKALPNNNWIIND